jgi:hypothetical protein
LIINFQWNKKIEVEEEEEEKKEEENLRGGK